MSWQRQGQPVRLRLRLRHFCCGNSASPRRTFAESVGDVAVAHARRSERLRVLQHHLGLALGGALIARMAQRLAMSVSGDTLVCLVRAAPMPTQPEPRIVGIDEWVWLRGRSYGTMVVDLERHTVLDLLPDRDAGSVAAWLRAHPGIEVIARDRSDVFAEGARGRAASPACRLSFSPASSPQRRSACDRRPSSWRDPRRRSRAHRSMDVMDSTPGSIRALRWRPRRSTGRRGFCRRSRSHSLRTIAPSSIACGLRHPIRGRAWPSRCLSPTPCDGDGARARVWRLGSRLRPRHRWRSSPRVSSATGVRHAARSRHPERRVRWRGRSSG